MLRPSTILTPTLPPWEREPRPKPGLRERWLAFRNRTVARPAFQRWAAGFPLTRGIARRNTRALFDLCAGFVYSQTLFACIRLDVFGALPLRYVQLYAGPHLGLRNPEDAGQRTAVAPEVGEPRRCLGHGHDRLAAGTCDDLDGEQPGTGLEG